MLRDEPEQNDRELVLLGYGALGTILPCGLPLGLVRKLGSSCRPCAERTDDLRVFTPPSCTARPIFPDQDAKPHAGATVAVFAASAQFQHALLQFIACDDTRRGWRRWFNRDRSRRWNRTIFRRDHDPRPVGALLIATILIITG